LKILIIIIVKIIKFDSFTLFEKQEFMYFLYEKLCILGKIIYCYFCIFLCLM